MHPIELIDRVEVHNTLGECVLWDERQNAVWWTDILEARLFRYELAQRQLTTFTLPEWLGSFGFTEREGWLVCAFATGLALYRPETGEIDWLARPEQHLNGATRFNDGRVDRQGRFWSGTKVEDTQAGVSGSLYCLSGRTLTQVLTDLHIPNSICWSPDASRFYFADSPTHTIQVFDFDAGSGAVTNGRTFIQTPAPYEPDGSIVDAEGLLWNAWWGGGRVVRYAHDGSVDTTVHTPVSQATCVAFGGKDLNLLFVSSATVGMSKEQLEGEPDAGNLLIYQTPYRGLPEVQFKI